MIVNLTALANTATGCAGSPSSYLCQQYGQSPYYDSGFQRVWLKRNLNLRGGILMSIGNFLDVLSQRILVGIILVGRLSVHVVVALLLQLPLILLLPLSCWWSQSLWRKRTVTWLLQQSACRFSSLWRANRPFCSALRFNAADCCSQTETASC